MFRVRVAKARPLFAWLGRHKPACPPGRLWAAIQPKAPQGCSEWEAFHAVVRWAAGGAALDEVEHLLSLVRYPLMSCRELEVRCGHARGAAQDGLLILHAALCECI